MFNFYSFTASKLKKKHLYYNSLQCFTVKYFIFYHERGRLLKQNSLLQSTQAISIIHTEQPEKKKHKYICEPLEPTNNMYLLARYVVTPGEVLRSSSPYAYKV